MYARAATPVGQREKSLRSMASQRSTLTLVRALISSREMPRRTRARRRLAPKASWLFTRLCRQSAFRSDYATLGRLDGQHRWPGCCTINHFGTPTHGFVTSRAADLQQRAHDPIGIVDQ